MEVLGIGPLEFLMVILLALIILGPKEMQNAGKTLGKNLNKLVKSDVWKVFRQTSEKIKYLPNELMREAEMDDHKIAPESQPPEPPKIVPPAGVKPPTKEIKPTPPSDEHQHG